MNIELDEVIVQDVSDDALEQAAGGAQGGCHSGWLFLCLTLSRGGHFAGHKTFNCWIAIADSKSIPTWVLATFGWLFYAPVKPSEQRV